MSEAAACPSRLPLTLLEILSPGFGVDGRQSICLNLESLISRMRICRCVHLQPEEMLSVLRYHSVLSQSSCWTRN